MRDLFVAESGLAQHFFGVLAEERRPAPDQRRRRRHLDRRAERAHPAERRVLDLHRHPPRGDLRIGEHLRVVVDRPARDAVRVEQVEPVRAAVWRW